MADPTARTGTATRVLIVRPSALGDVSRTVPVLVSLRRAFGDAQIDWLVRDAFTDAIDTHPDLNEVVGFPRNKLRGWWRGPSGIRHVRQYMNMLRDRQYDRVYDLQGLGRSGWLTWSTRAAKRIGFADARELAWLGYNVRHRVEAGPHTVDQMLGLLEADGIKPIRDLRLYVSETDRQTIAARAEAEGIADNKLAVIAPTAAWVSKQWPIERFAEAVAHLPKFGISAAVVVGGPGDREYVGPLVKSDGDVKLFDQTGQTSVGELMAWIERSSVVLCNDSAALHIAVGLGKRAVAVFGPTDPARVGPYRYDLAVVRPRNAAPVRYRAARLGDELIRQVSVAQVVERLEQVMAADPPRTQWD